MNNRLKTMQSRCFDIEPSCCEQTMTCDPLQTLPLAMAYVPWQQWKNVYEGGKGLEHGTIFEELIFPFQFASRVCGNSCMNQNRYSDCNTNWNSQNGMYMDYNVHHNNCNNNSNTCRNNSINGCNNSCNSKKTSNCGRRCD